MRAPAELSEAARLLGPRARRDAPLGALTTYRVGGRAALFFAAGGADDLAAARRAVAATGLPVLVLGRGSNMLVADAGFPGLVLTLGEAFAAVEADGGGLVRAGGAAQLPVLARRTAAMALTGLEWAVGVPGSVGGAVRMNAGGHGSDIAATLRRFSYVDLAGGPDGERDVEHLSFAYRHSTVAATHVVTAAWFALAPGDSAAALATIAAIVRWRRDHQPGGQNAGSVFTNPPGDSAGRLVEAAGLKGMRRATAQVSDKHANFIQAAPGGSADDVWALVQEVQRLVAERTGVELRTEVRLVGLPAAAPSRSSGGSW
ncbi:MAG: UDP-N-acetylmuramate dehydrogenase [Actinobacteria bacterium]|nr:UDP-N-acetylmuramate dehydrogenase [Actinomycetota bacterium]